MNVLLVRPPARDSALYPPFSLIALAPYFNGDVRICDMQHDGHLPTALQWHPDVVGFTGFSNQLATVEALCASVKHQVNATTIVGGPGVTATPDVAQRVLQHADHVVLGDGEPFAQQLTSPRGTGSQVTPARYDFHDHRIPAWNLIRYQQYRRFPGFAVETSRGCPYNCVFCTAHIVCGRRWRARSPRSVVDELSLLRDLYGCTTFYFPDDNATADPARWTQLMHAIVDADLDITLHAPEGLQAHHLSRSTLELMQQAGFTMITIGAESGVQRVLDDVIDKGGLTVAQVESVVRDCADIGLGVNCFFVVGIAGETLDEARATVAFAQHLRQLGAYSCMVRNAIPVPGTRLFTLAKERGYLTVPPDRLYDFDFLHTGQHLLATDEWTPRDIEQLVAHAKQQDARHIMFHQKRHVFVQGVRKFLRHPWHTVQRLRQVVRDTV